MADVFSVDYNKSLLRIVHASAPASLAGDDSKVRIGMDIPPLGWGEYTMVTCKPEIPSGPVTIFRLFGWDYDKIHLTIGELLTCNLEKEVKADIKITGDIPINAGAASSSAFVFAWLSFLNLISGEKISKKSLTKFFI